VFILYGAKLLVDLSMDRENLEKFMKRSQEIIENSSQMNEQNTKVKIIQPFIQNVLGWDIFSDVELEYPVTMGSTIKNVDYAMILEETPVVFIEAKGCDSNISDKDKSQLKSYMRQQGVDWGLLTNGKVFEILKRKKDLSHPEEVSLGKIHLDNLKNKLNILKVLSSESIKSGESEKFAKNIESRKKSVKKLKEKKEDLVNKITKLIADEIGDSVTQDIEKYSKKFIDDLGATLESPYKKCSKSEGTESYDGEKSAIKSEKYDINESEPYVKKTFEYVVEEMKNYESNIKVNPQKHYVSLRDGKNFAIIQIRKTKLNLIPKLPLEKGKKIINKNEIDELSESVQEFYNSPCFRIKLKEFDEQKLDEVVETLKAAHEYYL